MKCAAAGMPRDTDDVPDLRFLARVLNLEGPNDAKEAALRYFSERQLPAELGATLAACWG